MHHTGAVQLGVHTQSDVVLTLVAAHLRQQQSASASSSNSGGGQAALRFLGPQLPAAARAAHHADWNTPSSTGDAVYSSSSSMASRTVLGVAGVCAVQVITVSCRSCCLTLMLASLKAGNVDLECSCCYKCEGHTTVANHQPLGLVMYIP